MSDKFSIKRMDLSQIKYEPLDGEVVFDTTTEKIMIYHNGAWQQTTLEGAGLNLGLYDINKQIITQLPPMENMEKATENIITLYEKYKNEYFMLYGKEISYFTLFQIIDDFWFPSDVIDCCNNVGVIKSMDLTEAEDAIEIWVENEDGPTCLYLFPYDNGLVKVGG